MYIIKSSTTTQKVITKQLLHQKIINYKQINALKTVLGSDWQSDCKVA